MTYRCHNCAEVIKSATRQQFCGIRCRDEFRRKQQDADLEQRRREAVGLGPRPPAPPTLSVTSAFQISADLDADYDRLHQRMKPGAVERRARQDLTPVVRGPLRDLTWPPRSPANPQIKDRINNK